MIHILTVSIASLIWSHTSATPIQVEKQKEIVMEASKEINVATFIAEQQNSSASYKMVDRAELTKALNSNLDYAAINTDRLVALRFGRPKAGRSPRKDLA